MGQLSYLTALPRDIYLLLAAEQQPKTKIANQKPKNTPMIKPINSPYKGFPCAKFTDFPLDFRTISSIMAFMEKAAILARMDAQKKAPALPMRLGYRRLESRTGPMDISRLLPPKSSIIELLNVGTISLLSSRGDTCQYSKIPKSIEKFIKSFGIRTCIGEIFL